MERDRPVMEQLMLAFDLDEGLNLGPLGDKLKVLSGRMGRCEENKNIDQYDTPDDGQVDSEMSAGKSVRGRGDPLVCAHNPRKGDDPDALLVEAAKQGDRLAFSELSTRYTALIYRKVFRLVRNREDAEDLVQETLLKAFKHLSRFRGAAKFSTWLQKIGINSALELLRWKRRSQESSFERCQDGNSWEALEFPDSAPNAEHMYAKCEARCLISLALGRLPRTYQVIVRAHHEEEQSLSDVAHTLGISVAAKARLFRARVTLRSVLKKENPIEHVMRSGPRSTLKCGIR